jgi:hypothetical protein
MISYRGTRQPTQRSNLCQRHKLEIIMISYMISLKNYDIIHDIIMYISDMAYDILYIHKKYDIIYDITMLPNIIYDIMKVA